GRRLAWRLPRGARRFLPLPPPPLRRVGANHLLREGWTVARLPVRLLQVAGPPGRGPRSAGDPRRPGHRRRRGLRPPPVPPRRPRGVSRRPSRPGGRRLRPDARGLDGGVPLRDAVLPLLLFGRVPALA